jgi:hypothetical protein
MRGPSRSAIEDLCKRYLNHVASTEDLMAASDRAVPPGLDDAVPGRVFVEARAL